MANSFIQGDTVDFKTLDVIELYKEQIERLEKLLDAEKVENNRLWMAVTTLQGAANTGYTTIRKAYYDSEDQSNDEKYYDEMATDIINTLEVVDKILSPFAIEVKED